MAACALDHLVVAARSLEEGVAWCEATLGVPPGPGGQHPMFSTHNRLLRLDGLAPESAPGIGSRATDDAAPVRYAQAYLEIIAIDPAASAPSRPRWFALDDPAMQERLRSGPKLVHAVMRSSNLEMHRWGLITLGHAVGDILSASRPTPQGLLQWRIVVRGDGGLMCGGALPTLIEWTGRHPCEAMPPSPLRLEELRLSGIAPRVRQLLQVPHLRYDDSPEAPALSARLLTPRGEVLLRSA
jgi:hypothetical protein